MGPAEDSMNAFALALALGAGPAGLEDRLPLSVSEPFVPPAEKEYAIWVGGHLGVADAEDGVDPCLVAGFRWKVAFLPWLAVGGSLDVQTQQEINDASGEDWFQVPFMFSALLTPPIDLGPFRFYVEAGGGFTITYYSGIASANTVHVNLLYFLGVGAEIALGSDVQLDINVRSVVAGTQAEIGDFDPDWVQVTVGVLVRLLE
jgi:hypothetical protein